MEDEYETNIVGPRHLFEIFIIMDISMRFYWLYSVPFIIIIIIIIIIDHLINLAVSVSDYWSWSHGFYSRYFQSLCGFGLERVSFVKEIG